MRITESRLRSIIRKVLIEINTPQQAKAALVRSVALGNEDDFEAALAKAYPEVKRKGIKLRVNRQPKKKGIKLRQNRRKKGGIKLRDKKTAGSKKDPYDIIFKKIAPSLFEIEKMIFSMSIEFKKKVEKDLEVEFELHQPFLVNYEKKPWATYRNNILSNKEYAFNIGGGGNDGMKGLVIKDHDLILFISFNNIDEIFNNSNTQYDNIIKLTGGGISKVNKAQEFFKDENNKPMDKIESMIKNLGFKKKKGF